MYWSGQNGAAVAVALMAVFMIADSQSGSQPPPNTGQPPSPPPPNNISDWYFCFNKFSPGQVTIKCPESGDILHVNQAELGSESKCRAGANCFMVPVPNVADLCNGRNECKIQINQTYDTCGQLVSFLQVQADCAPPADDFVIHQCYSPINGPKSVNISCPTPGDWIYIYRADVGHDGDCDGTSGGITCQEALKDIKNTCNGRRDCNALLPSSLNQCSKTPNYVDIDYTCYQREHDVTYAEDIMYEADRPFRLVSPSYPTPYSKLYSGMGYQCNCNLKRTSSSQDAYFRIRLIRFILLSTPQCTADWVKIGDNRYCSPSLERSWLNITRISIPVEFNVAPQLHGYAGFVLEVLVRGNTNPNATIELTCQGATPSTTQGYSTTTTKTDLQTTPATVPTTPAATVPTTPAATVAAPPATIQQTQPPPTKQPPPPTGGTPSGNTMDIAVIIGVSVGGAVVLIIVVAVVVFCILKWKRKNSPGRRTLPPLPQADKFENIYPGPATAPRRTGSGVDNLAYKGEQEDMYETIPYEEYVPGKEPTYLDMYGGDRKQSTAYVEPDSLKRSQNHYVGLNNGAKPDEQNVGQTGSANAYEGLSSARNEASYTYASNPQSNNDVPQSEKTTTL